MTGPAGAPLLAAGLGSTVTQGSLLLAVPVALLAGLVSFLSPCVLPLVPGYLAFVTGMSGAEAQESPGRARAAMVAGSLLFVAGFAAVFVTAGAAFGTLGTVLRAHADTISRVLGVGIIVLGLGFLGFVPLLAREARFHRLPRAGVLGAPLLGVAFGLGWTPCIGPTLAAVLGLAYDQATATRGAFLALVYCLGLGLPFVLTAVAAGSAARALGWVRRHQRGITSLGGAMLVVVGLLLVTGWWNQVVIALRDVAPGFSPAV